jgi:ABC-type transport system involved in multi-copper enzyme maturation permease subunit
MTFLPIVERELRVAARRRGTYWTRSVMSLGAILIGVFVFVFCIGLPAQQTARYIFQGLAGLLMLYCLGRGRATTDCLSREKREGTLGLLFLTHLKGHDVVLGKLAATSLGSFYALLAAVPVLAVPLLMGGTTYGEFWRMVLTLIDTFLFCLVVGIFSSALCREHRQAAALNLNLLLFLAAAPPAAACALLYFHPALGLMRPLFFSCPLYTFYLSSDARYRLEPEHFWWSLGVIHGLTWLLLMLASWAARHTLRERPERLDRTGWRGSWRRWSYGDARRQAAFRRRLLDINPLYWLAGRARLRPLHVWTFLGLAAAWWLCGWACSGIYWLDKTVCLCTALLLNSTFKVWVILEAGQRLSEEREAGIFELLLTTPVSVADLLRGQWLALRRQFLGPVLAVIAAESLLVRSLYPRYLGWSDVLFWLAGTIMLAADLVALGWVTMLAALRAKTQHRATVTAITRLLVLPWLLWGAAVWLPCLWLAAWSGIVGPMPGWQYCLGWWVGLGLGIDLLFGLWAWWVLRHRFRQIVLNQFALPPAIPGFKPPSAAHAKVTADLPERRTGPLQGQRPPKGRLKRRAALASVAAVLLMASLISTVWRSRSGPLPPVLVYLARSNAPPRFVADWSGALLILPDGSLWRWGQPGGLRKSVVPERVGTNYDWVQVAVAQDCCVGLRTNGTIWQWSPVGDLSGIPEQVSAAKALPWPDSAPASNGARGTTALPDLDQGWSSVAVGRTNLSAFGPATAFALRLDGTLWSWSPGSGPAHARLFQMGGDHDWAALCGATLRLRTNGTLWVQGNFARRPFASPGQQPDAPSPVQVCRDTNWLAFGSSELAEGWTASGQLCDLSTLSPDAQAPAATTCQVITSNSAPGRHALAAFNQEGPLYEVRPDGTLWHGGRAATSLATLNHIADWRRVGNRTDWVSIWGAGRTAFGLTADGTIWTWGVDMGRDPLDDLSTRLKYMRLRIQSMFRGGRGAAGPAMMPYIQKEPRPLLRLLSTNRQKGGGR